MSKESEEFLERLLYFFPSAENEYLKSIDEFGEPLEIIIVEDIFMPKIIELLEKNSNKKFLDNIFEYFEVVANCEDSHLKNIF